MTSASTPATPTKKPTTTPTTRPTATPTTRPTATPSPSPTPAGDLTPSQWRAELFRLTNVERAAAGVPALAPPCAGLLEAAGIRAGEIAVLFSHTRPDGSECFSVLAECSVPSRTRGENIAKATTGYRSPAQVIQMWMDSKGHRDNILSPHYTSVGIGYQKSGGYEHFVQLFIG